MAVPEIRQYANVKVENIANVSSADITIDHWITLANRINQIFAQDSKLAGIVITHGTNTLDGDRSLPESGAIFRVGGKPGAGYYGVNREQSAPRIEPASVTETTA